MAIKTSLVDGVVYYLVMSVIIIQIYIYIYIYIYTKH